MFGRWKIEASSAVYITKELSGNSRSTTFSLKSEIPSAGATWIKEFKLAEENWRKEAAAPRRSAEQFSGSKAAVKTLTIVSKPTRVSLSSIIFRSSSCPDESRGISCLGGSGLEGGVNREGLRSCLIA